MTDYSELKRLAEAATNARWHEDDLGYELGFSLLDGEDEAFILAASPSAVFEMIAELEKAQAERDQLQAENEALRKGIDPAWSLMDQSILIDHLRLNTNFTADKFDAMIQFAVECAQYVELNPRQGEKSGG